MAAIRCVTCQMFARVNELTPPGITERFQFYPNTPNMHQVLIHEANIRIVNICDICGAELSEHVFNVVTDFSNAINHICPNQDIGIGWSCRLTSCHRETRLYPPNKRIQTKYHFIVYKGLLRCPCDAIKLEFEGERNVKTSDMLKV